MVEKLQGQARISKKEVEHQHTDDRRRQTADAVGGDCRNHQYAEDVNRDYIGLRKAKGVKQARQQCGSCQHRQAF